MALTVLSTAGTPTNGTSAVQTITITGTPTGGTFRLRCAGKLSAPIAYNASASAVQSALRALPSVGSGGVTCSGGALPGTPVDVTFTGRLANLDVATIIVEHTALTGGEAPAVAISVETAGETATHRTAAPGQPLVDTDEPALYLNHGVVYAPDWRAASAFQVVGSQVALGGEDAVSTLPLVSIASTFVHLQGAVVLPAVSASEGGPALVFGGDFSKALTLNAEDATEFTVLGIQRSGTMSLRSVVLSATGAAVQDVTGPMTSAQLGMLNAEGDGWSSVDLLPEGARCDLWGLRV